MDVGSLLSNGAAVAENSRSATADDKLNNDFSTFLTLLTTQLQNQDPLDPLDSNEFTQQLVAFSGVEQQIQTNANLEKLASLTQLNNMAGASSFLSHEAIIASPNATLEGGDAVWDYQITEGANDVTLKIFDSAGALVYQQNGESKLGTHQFKWNGLTTDGTTRTEGSFTLSVEGTNDEGNDLHTPIFVTDRIVAVDTQGEQPIFQVGTNQVFQSDILGLSVGR